MGCNDLFEKTEEFAKEFFEKTEEFAKKIINLAADEGLTVREVCEAADTAKAIANYSLVDKNSVEMLDYRSRHIVTKCDGKILFSD